MAIIVMDDRRVKTKSIHLPYPITKEEVEKKADELNAKIRNNEIAINDIEKFLQKVQILFMNMMMKMNLASTL